MMKSASPMPHKMLLGRVWLSFLALSLLVPTAHSLAAPKSIGQEVREKAGLITAINRERAAHGLGLLTEDVLLSKAACAHSLEMSVRDYFDHHSPTPTLATPMDRYLNCLHGIGGTPPDTLRIGENLYYCSLFNNVYTVDYGHRALMASPEHRANILDPHFTKIGLGLYHDSQGGFWMTEMFLGNPKSAP